MRFQGLGCGHLFVCVEGGGGYHLAHDGALSVKKFKVNCTIKV